MRKVLIWLRQRRTGVSSFLAVSLLLATALLSGCRAQAQAHPDDAEVRKFLERYFSTWSARDMEGYGACFHPQARVFVLDGPSVVSQGLTDFLHGQKLAHEMASTPMTEKPVTMTIQGDAKGVQAYVTWVLTKGSKEERGSDLFTLKKEASGGWKIVSLVFYGE
ncbi:nuclear transport factor 2 family protein [Verrucomicrobium sp. BvORR106]|uniref:YybH family protein n=1 Tax=Verrucomicrobium sp. BvORR106 TaxID=1403819 RepID=UPI00056E06FC|nr:nuclear transport factor 2 family protein [Verrucomicrobium sp. BvORR106]